MVSHFIKKAIKIVLLPAIISTAVSAVDIKNLSIAVDVAGKQRMFTQRMLKDYAMVGIENHFGNPDQDLKKIMGLFDKHLDLLLAFNKDAATEESLTKVRVLWDPLFIALNEVPTKEKAGQMQVDLEALLKQANEAVGLFAKQTGKASGEIINISGRQRMLSQRMASLYMLKVWGINDSEFKTKMTKAMDLYRTSLVKLEKSDMSTDEIMKLLKKSKKAFKFFQIMNKSSSKFIPTLIYKKSNEMLRDMNTATGLYAAQEK